MVIQSNKWSKYFPWLWPGYAIVKEGADFRPVALLLGLAGGVLVGLIGMWLVSRREVV